VTGERPEGSGAPSRDRPRLVLVGAGHVHLEILRRFATDGPRPYDVTIVSLEERHFYSGMTPGYLAGQYTYDDLTSHVPSVATRAGARCVIGRAAGLDPKARIVRLEDGREIGYDVVSLNIGSLLLGTGTELTRHAELIKPFHRVERIKQRLDELLAEEPDGKVSVVVVGAGAAGVEIAFALAATLDRAGRSRSVSIVEAGDHILSGYAPRFREKAQRVLRGSGIQVILGERVTEVTTNEVGLENGHRLPCDLTVWLTGPQAASWLAETGLPTDRRGFLLIEDTLRSGGDPAVFAVGDCGTLKAYPDTPKAGVFAVREAPVLWHNLLALSTGEPLQRYEPQQGFLSILNTCDGKALLRYKGLVSWSRWAWWLKDWIDRRFMRKYQEVARSEG